MPFSSRIRPILIAALLAPLVAALPNAAPSVQAQSLTTVTPGRILDTRPTGATVDDQQEATGAFGAGETRTLPVANRAGVPASGVTAVALNITAISPSATSFVTAYATGTARPNASNLNLAAGRTLPNMAIVPLGTGGAIDLFNSAGTTHLAVDVMGWFGATGDYTPVDPGRLLDTRPTGATVDDQQEATGAFGAAETRTLPIAGRGGVPITGVSAVALNITAISPSANSFITAYPSGTSRPTTSNLNLSAGQTIPNMAIVTLGANGAIDLFNSAGTTQLAVDVMGWFATGGDYTTVAPGRLLDTRPSGSTVDAQQQGGGTLGAGETRLLPIAGRGGVPATGVAAVAVNITAVGPTATSFVTAFPAGTTRPNASNLNLAAGRTLPNMALVPLGANGAIELFNSAGTTHLLVDVVGWFPPDPAPSTTLLSKRVDNVPRVGFFTGLDVARDGGFAAFATGASNLIPGDTNGVSDVFVVDLTTGAIERVSVADNEAQLAAASTVPAISDDGRFVTFLTQAAGAGDTNNVVDVYRRDRQTGTTALVSSLPGGALLEFAATDQDLSGNGDVVAFSASRDDGFGDPLPTTFVSSISTDTTEEAALSFTNFRTGSSSGVSISEDGDKVAFSKIFTSNTSVSHVFRYDVSANTITQMTAAGGGQPGGSNPVLSDDGVAVVYGRAFTTAVTLSAGGAEQVIDTNQGTGEYRFAGSSKNVLLASSAALVPGDNNGFFDVYLATTGASPTITLLSVFFKPAGVLPANGSSLLPAMSADQQTLVFATSAQNLSGVVSDPTSLVMQRDEEYTLLTAADTGVTAHGSSTRPVFSTDGRYVVFTSDAEDLTVDEFDQLTDVYRLDRFTGQILEVSVDNAEAPINTHPVREPDVSADGNRIVFLTSADVPAVNLNNASDGKQQVFVRDVNAGTTTAVSHKPGNQPGSGVNTEPAISGNGRFVVFLSSSNDLVAGDTNNSPDVFLRDLQTGAIERVSLTSGDAQITGATNDSVMSPDVSFDGRYVTFTSTATNVVPGATTALGRVYRRDRVAGTTELVAAGTASEMSADGRFVTFASSATDLVAGDSNAQFDVFVKDMVTGVITRISVATGGGQATGGGSSLPRLSANGRWVVFLSTSTNMVAGDTNGVSDVFLHDRVLGTTVRVSVDSAGGEQNAASLEQPSVTESGRFVAFSSTGSNLVAGDTNPAVDVFLRDLG